MGGVDGGGAVGGAVDGRAFRWGVGGSWWGSSEMSGL